MRLPRGLLLTAGLCAAVLLPLGARADEPDLEAEVVIHVPVHEMDVLLEADHRGVVLRHSEYRALLDKARARRETAQRAAPAAAALLRADGALDLAKGELVLTYDLQHLSAESTSMPFVVQGIAIETVEIEGEGRYEEMGGFGRLRMEGAGARRVILRGAVRVVEKGARRQVAMRVPPAAAMALEVTLPAAATGVFQGAGAVRHFRTQPRESHVLLAGPAPDGRVAVAWDPAAQGEDLPPVIDASLHQTHTLTDDMILTRVALAVDVLRAPAREIRLRLPAETIVREAGGKGVVGTSRSEDRGVLTLKLETSRQGRLDLALHLETPYAPGPAVLLPTIQIEKAARQRAEAAIRADHGVTLRRVKVVGGRRLQAVRKKGQPLWLRYALARTDSELLVDVLPKERRIDAASTYYLNLTEPARTLLAVVTYHVREGELFRLEPRFPEGYALTKLQVNGVETGFRRDVRDDGVIEIRLDRGVKEGGQVAVAATLQKSGVDWVPDDGAVVVPFTVPSAGAQHEEGFVGVGADASFQVLDADARDLVAVGAAELTARGVTPAGLVYGYRLDGDSPSVRLEVERRVPRIEAVIVAQARPTPRRLEVVARVRHVVERAGVRRFDVFLPTWARETVRVEGRDVVAHHRIEDAAESVGGFDRWRVDLGRRVLGRHVLRIRYHEEQDVDDWRVPDGRPLAPRLPVEQAARIVVLERAYGLEVDTLGDVSLGDLADLPPGIGIDAMSVREVVRLGNGREGPGIAVRKHEGAAVLDAIAARVRLDTAVADAGILRTRATVRLVNVGLQFLQVALPRGSSLVGAIVDGQPVKPLVDARGVLRVPVPPSRRRGAQVTAELTYDTQMDEKVGAEVRVPAPIFPGLEVLKTEHEVAFDPRLEIQRVEGDFGVAQPRPREHLPWILQALGALTVYKLGASADGARPSSADVGAPQGATISLSENLDPASVTTSAAVPQDDPWGAEETKRVARGFETYEDARDDDSEELEPVIEEEMIDHVETDNSLPFQESMGEEDGLSDAPFRGPANARPPGFRQPSDPSPEPPPPPSGPPAGQGRAPPTPGVEGPGGLPQPTRPRARPRRKGLLSLDVPVLLSPNRLRGERLGQGGAMIVSVVDAKAPQRSHLLFTLAFLAVGLVFSRRNPRYRIVAPLVLVGLAIAAAIVFGAHAALVATALVDAATLMLAVQGLVWLARKTFLRSPRPVVAALVLLGLSLALVAVPAAAKEKGKAPPPKPRAPRTVYVPYDPEDPKVPRDDDRVYLPLDTWMALRQRAGVKDGARASEQAPAVGVLALSHRVTVRGAQAEVETVLDLVKRGTRAAFVAVPFAGIGVTEATLGGEPVELVQQKGVPHVLLDPEGDHRLQLRYRVPVESGPLARKIAWQSPRHAGATLDVEAPGFDGRFVVTGAARVTELGDGRASVRLGALSKIELRLVQPEPTEPDVPLRTRGESRTFHRVLDGGTESEIRLTLHVLQGEARYAELGVPPGVELLDAGGKDVARWETQDGAIRLVFAKPVTSRADVYVRAIRLAEAPSREEQLPALALQDTTGESGLVAITTDPLIRVEPVETRGLLRTAAPSPKEACSYPPPRRIASAWRFAARPTSFRIRTEVQASALSIESTQAVVFGDDHVHSRIDAVVSIDERKPMGEFELDLPGEDRVVDVKSPGLERWWTEGEGDERSLLVRYADLRRGQVRLTIVTDLRLGGRRDGLLVPRAALRGALRDQGRLVLFALPDVDIAPGGLPGLRALPLQRVQIPAPPVAGAKPQLAYAWEEPLGTSLPVAQGTPSLEVEAVVVSAVRPSDDATSVEHLVLFDVRRGLTDRFQLFVPDGGMAADDLVRTSDLREIRPEPAIRRGPDGEEVAGTLYGLRLQTPRRGLVEVTVSQRVLPDALVRAVRPEGVKGTRWFGLVGAFLDGEVQVGIRGADKAAWEDVPFLPAGLQATDVVEVVLARAPYTLEIDAKRHQLQLEAGALVTAAFADVVLGRDGQIRVQMTYRLFNRREQFLRVRLPLQALLYGSTVNGRPVKPLDGPEGDILVPVPKVPLGGAGYAVSLLYRAPAGARLPSPDLRIALPEIVGVEVDRSAVRLYVPKDFAYAVDTTMIEAEATDLTADLAEAAVQEARDLLEIAKGGTLAQRRLAAGNVRRLVDEAGVLNRRAGQKRGKLNRDVAQAKQQFDAQWKAVQRDLARQTRVQAGQQVDAIASNAQQILIVDQNERSSQPGATMNPGWLFNPKEAGEGQNKAEVQALKQRLGKALEQRKNETWTTRGHVPALLADTGVDFRGLGSLETAASANFQMLNAYLVEDQNRNGQLGVTLLPQREMAQQQGQDEVQFGSAANPYGVPFPVYPGRANLDDVTNGLEDQASAGYDNGGGGPTTGASQNPASGLYFNDGSDGDFRARTENIMSGTIGEGGGAGGTFAHDRATTRRGLMGVQVELPREGRVFYFRSAKAGAPIELAARATSWPMWLRWILYILLVAGAVMLVAGVSRARAKHRVATA